MAVWNAERYVGEAVASVLSQLGPDDEVVVVDDGSTDRTLEVLVSYGDRVHVLAEPHRGVGAARNTSLDACRGRYQGFLDADDRWAPGALDALLGGLEGDPSADIVVGVTDEFLDEGIDSPEAAGLRPPEQGVRGWFLGTMLGHRAAFERVRFDEQQHLASTADWLTRIRETGVTFRPLDRVTLERRIRRDSLSADGDAYRQALMSSLRTKISRHRARP
jgi:glycosyltransferase involved in cell wall biosynthesis